MRTLGLSGFAQSGKTTAANYIEQKYGFTRRHIAEPLRAMLAVLMRANNIPEDMIDRYLVGDLKDGVPIPELGGRTSRYLQVKLGTEFGREMVHPDLWVDTWHRGIAPGEKAMNDSVRFANEEEAIDIDDGITILIRRKGTGPGAFKWNLFGLPLGKLLYRTTGLMWGVHDSERTDRLNPSAIIDNDGTLEELYAAIDDVMQAFARYTATPESANDNVEFAEERLLIMNRWGWLAEDVACLSREEVVYFADHIRGMQLREQLEKAA